MLVRSCATRGRLKKNETNTAYIHDDRKLRSSALHYLEVEGLERYHTRGNMHAKTFDKKPYG